MEKNKWRIQLFLLFVMQGHDLLMFSFAIGWRLKIIIIDDGDHHQRRSSLLSCWWFNLDHKMDPVQRTLLVWVTMMMMMIDIGKECVCVCFQSQDCREKCSIGETIWEHVHVLEHTIERYIIQCNLNWNSNQNQLGGGNGQK